MILAVDTSGPGMSAALVRDGACIDLQFEESRAAAELLVPLVDRLLTRNEISVTKIRQLAVCTGPGSFTGLRSGIGVITGLAIAHDIPVFGISCFVGAACAGRDGLRGRVLFFKRANAAEFFAAGLDINGEPRRPVIAEFLPITVIPGERIEEARENAGELAAGCRIVELEKDLGWADICAGIGVASGAAELSVGAQMREGMPVEPLYGKGVNAKTTAERRRSATGLSRDQ